MQFLEAHLIHFIATDAHNTTTRGFCLQEAYQKVTKEYGEKRSHILMENSQLLMDGENIHIVEPERIRIHKKKKFRSEEHTSELQSRFDLVCRLLLEK